MREYASIIGKTLDPMTPEPQLSDFYTSSDDQNDREMAFVVQGMGATDVVAFILTKYFAWRI